MKNPKPDDAIGIGIIGLGSRGNNLGGNVFAKRADCRIVGLCDLNPANLATARDTFGDVPATTSIDEFLRMPGMDAVIICSNDFAHADNALAALAAGKHVYLEKPMAQTIEDCDKIIEAQAAAQRVVMVGLELRFCSLFEEMKRLIAAGEIGEIKIGTVTDNVSVGGQYYYHNARRRKDFVGSLILEKGVHSLDLTNWLLEASPVKVYCSGGLDVFGGHEPADKRCRDCDEAGDCNYYVDLSTRSRRLQFKDDLCVYSEECDVHDNSLVLIDYDNGARISYMECQFTPEYSREFVFVGTKGKMVGFYNNQQEFKIVVTKRHRRGEDVYYPERRSGVHGGGDERIVERFVQLVKADECSFAGVWGARDSVAIAAAALESAETGLPVEIRANPILSKLKAPR